VTGARPPNTWRARAASPHATDVSSSPPTSLSAPNRAMRHALDLVGHLNSLY
jgi:hypothetical protein